MTPPNPRWRALALTALLAAFVAPATAADPETPDAAVVAPMSLPPLADDPAAVAVGTPEGDPGAATHWYVVDAGEAREADDARAEPRWYRYNLTSGERHEGNITWTVTTPEEGHEERRVLRRGHAEMEGVRLDVVLVSG